MAAHDQVVPENCELVFSESRIQQALDELADQLNKRFMGERVTTLCVMNGGLIFAGHLLTRLSFDCVIDYCHATRYRNKTQGQDLHWMAEPQSSLKGSIVLVLDDILDEGNTMKAIVEYCNDKGASSVVPVVLLDKHHDRRVDGVTAEHAALQVDDRYVFGFGMDVEGKHRQLGAIYALSEY